MAQTLHLFPLRGQAKWSPALSPLSLTPGPSTPSCHKGGGEVNKEEKEMGMGARGRHE